jgi:hypothetical protein
MLWRVVIASSLLVAAGWGQSSGTAPQPAAPPRSPFAMPIRAVPPPAAPAKPTAQQPAKRGAAAKPVVAITAKPVAPPPPNPEVKPAPRKLVDARDPFLSPVQVEKDQPSCTAGGKRCLVINRITLQGVVRTESGFIAVVVNAANRAFFLRENDPLWDGYVLRITSNAVTFMENGKDRLGRPTSREVTKTLGRPAA